LVGNSFPYLNLSFLVLQRDQLQIDGLQGRIPGLPDALVGAAISALEDYLIQTIQASLGEVVLGDLGCMLNIEGRLRRTGDTTTRVLHIAQVLAGDA